eukprot:TRINITY_DN12587_c0_g1_i1.p1 TRINITY_DN12587_c0_g1~~TRINITY_DN12587_c0_g1_i1.p1  ORF type:complete len:337 (-),score=99.63 TRINITY_DN12587_c0_g1_i1:1121-2131(-)
MAAADAILLNGNCVGSSLSYGQALGVGVLLVVNFLQILLVIANKPYLNRLDNMLAVLSPACAAISLILGLVGLTGIRAVIVVADILYLIMFVVGFSIQIFALSWSCRSFRNKVNKKFGKVKFTVITQNGKMFPFFQDPALDLGKEVRKRLWMEFWDFFFFAFPEACKQILNRVDAKKAENLPMKSFAYRPDFRLIAERFPFLNDFQGSVLERHLENKELVKALGFERYKQAVMVNREYFPLKHEVTIKVSGPDSYLDGSGFGKATFISFPPVLVFYPDGSPAFPVIKTEPNEWEQLLERNTQDDEILRRKDIRNVLRAIHGRHVRYHLLRILSFET